MTAGTAGFLDSNSISGMLFYQHKFFMNSFNLSLRGTATYSSTEKAGGAAGCNFEFFLDRKFGINPGISAGVYHREDQPDIPGPELEGRLAAFYRFTGGNLVYRFVYIYNPDYMSQKHSIGLSLGL